MTHPTDWLTSLSRRAQQPTVIVVGLMSGTSADGIDAVVAELTDDRARTRVRELAFTETSYPPDTRARLFRLFRGEGNVAEVCALNVLIAESFADAVLSALTSAQVDGSDILAVGSHGQTVWHQPPSAGQKPFATLQLGDPSVIAARTGIPVVSDFRSADVALGGEGAPLVPYLDWLLFRDDARGRVLQNIGGIANATYLQPNAAPDDVIAFDTGPGNALMDAAVSILTDGSETFDRDGIRAATGNVLPDLLAELMRDPYLVAHLPKSTGRERFGEPFVREWLSRVDNHPANDLIATLTAFTAESLADAYTRFLASRGRIDEVIVSGGGAKNPTLIRLFQDALKRRELTPTFRSPDEWGVRAESKEAVAFAVFARETLRGVPANLPSVTGASRCAILGSVTPATM